MKIKDITVFCLVTLVRFAYGQDSENSALFGNVYLTVDSLIGNQLPEIEYRGECVEAICWVDKGGEHILLLSETGEEVSDEEGYRNAFVWGYHFLNTEGG